MNAAADEAGVNEINKTIKAAANPQKFGVDKIREATKIDPLASAKSKGVSDAKPVGEPASETDKLRAEMTEERKATAQKMSDAMAKAAEERIAREKAAEAADAAPKDAQ